jgi:hypothetical protein|tara:strand:+ start:488 stop:724 length:237 start_codon:yes stop_codon:yes gene_type:complete
MPLYDFENIETGEVETKMMSISSMEEYVKDPNIRQVLAAPKLIGGNKSTISQVSDGFNDVLKSIKSSSDQSRCTIETK